MVSCSFSLSASDMLTYVAFKPHCGEDMTSHFDVVDNVECRETV